MMALTHHLIIRYAAHICGIRRPDYAILGDDALIVGDELFESYMKVTTSLNMEVNLTKTFRSTRLVEFAKRFFLDREEVSAFPLGALVSSSCDLAKVSQTYSNAIAKGYFGSDRFADCDLERIRSSALEQYRYLWRLRFGDKAKAKPFDISIAGRVIRILRMQAIVAAIYRTGFNEDNHLRKLLLGYVSCTRKVPRIRKRLLEIISHHLREKALRTLGDAHLPVFMKINEINMGLMMCGLVPPPPVDPTQPPG